MHIIKLSHNHYLLDSSTVKVQRTVWSFNRYPIALNQTLLVDGKLIKKPYWYKVKHTVTDRMIESNVSLKFSQNTF